MSAANIIDTSAQPALATWTSDSQACCRLEALKFHIFYDPSTNAAFFKLRAPVTFQATVAKPKRTTAVWLFIAPERIATLAVQDEDEIDEATKKQLGPNAVCLRFGLNRPATLVLPPDVDQDCNEKACGEALNPLRSLARAASFTVSVCLPSRTVSQAQLLSLCAAASRSTGSSCEVPTAGSESLVSSKHAADTASLYGGKGGRAIEGDSSELLEETRNEVLPPPYANIGVSPPSVPASWPEKKRRRRASSDAGPDPGRHHHGKGFALKAALEEFKAELRSEVRHQLTSEFVVEAKAELKRELKAELLAELRTELKAELRRELAAELKSELVTEVTQEVETRVLQRFEQRLQDQATDFEAQVYDVRHEVGATVYSEVEDQTYAARLELEEFVKDEMKEAQQRVEDRIADRLQTANLNITF